MVQIMLSQHSEMVLRFRKWEGEGGEGSHHIIDNLCIWGVITGRARGCARVMGAFKSLIGI